MILPILLVAIGSLLGCVASGDVAYTGAVTAETCGTLEWQVELNGLRAVSITASDFKELKTEAADDGMARALTVERKGVESTYQGVGLKDLITRLYARDLEAYAKTEGDLWATGYEMTMTASDGYSVTFSSSEMDANSLVLYDLKDGELVYPGTVGEEISSKYSINDLAAIELRFIGLEEAAIEEMDTLELDINGEQIELSLSELSKTPYYAVGKGGYTTSAGTYYENSYGGIRLADFLTSFIQLLDSSTITLLSTDGYSMSYAFSEISSMDDGVWLLAFEMDGKPLDEETGPFRGVRIAQALGDSIPNIDGHSSPKMVKRIEISQEVFKDFSLLIKGKMEAILNRATIQSGINCTAHKTTVEYMDRKTGQLEQYVGMPLFALLAFGDDPKYAPHKQNDKSIVAYDKMAARDGYLVKIIARDGYSIVLDSRELDGNHDVILAMYQNEHELSGDAWPLKLVWDHAAEVVPKGIKSVKNVVAVELLF